MQPPHVAVLQRYHLPFGAVCEVRRREYSSSEELQLLYNVDVYVQQMCEDKIFATYQNIDHIVCCVDKSFAALKNLILVG